MVAAQVYREISKQERKQREGEGRTGRRKGTAKRNGSICWRFDDWQLYLSTLLYPRFSTFYGFFKPWETEKFIFFLFDSTHHAWLYEYGRDGSNTRVDWKSLDWKLNSQLQISFASYDQNCISNFINVETNKKKTYISTYLSRIHNQTNIKSY